MHAPSLVTALHIALLGLSRPIWSAPSPCESGTWINLADLPIPRQEFSAVALNGNSIIVIGGVVQTSNGSIVTTDLVQSYSIAADKWSTLPRAPFKVNHPNVASVNGKIYLLGGLIDDPLTPGALVNWVASPSCYVYDPATRRWQQLDPMPPGTERGSAYTGVYGEMTFLAGGMSLLQQGYQDSLTMVTAFNTSSGKWQRVPPAAAQIPEGRQHGVGAVVGHSFYVVGGRWFGQLNSRGTVYALDLSNQQLGWQAAAMQMPVPRGGVAGDAVGGKIYTFGGEGDVRSDSGVFPESEAFDVAGQSWGELARMPVPRHGTHAVAVGNLVYIAGGGLQMDGKPVTTNGTLRFSNPTAHFDAYCV